MYFHRKQIRPSEQVTSNRHSHIIHDNLPLYEESVFYLYMYVQEKTVGFLSTRFSTICKTNRFWVKTFQKVEAQLIFQRTHRCDQE